MIKKKVNLVEVFFVTKLMYNMSITKSTYVLIFYSTLLLLFSSNLIKIKHGVNYFFCMKNNIVGGVIKLLI